MSLTKSNSPTALQRLQVMWCWQGAWRWWEILSLQRKNDLSPAGMWLQLIYMSTSSWSEPVHGGRGVDMTVWQGMRCRKNEECIQLCLYYSQSSFHASPVPHTFFFLFLTPGGRQLQGSAGFQLGALWWPRGVGWEGWREVQKGGDCGSDGKEFTCSVGDWGSIPGSGRFFGGGHGNPLLGYPMNRGAWKGTIHRVAKSQTWL